MGIFNNKDQYNELLDKYCRMDNHIKQLEKEIDQLKDENSSLKNELETIKSQENIIELEKVSNNLQQEVNQLKRHSDVIEKSNNFLFNCLFLDTPLEIVGVRRNMQVLCQELLDFVVQVCEKYSLDYWLDFGTLLGALRHENYIPFDDDMDISMTRKDYNRFLEIIGHEIEKNGLDDVLTVKHDFFNKYSQITFIQISYSRNSRLIAAIDIFPYDFIPEKSITEDKYSLEKRYFRNKIESGELERDYLEKNFMRQLNLTYDVEDHMIMGVECPIRNLIYFETKEVFPLSEITFSKKQYNCPRYSDIHIKKIYGNWKVIPPEIHFHGRLDSLRNNKNVEKIYEEEIRRMREINSDFTSH